MVYLPFPGPPQQRGTNRVISMLECILTVLEAGGRLFRRWQGRALTGALGETPQPPVVPPVPGVPRSVAASFLPLPLSSHGLPCVPSWLCLRTPVTLDGATHLASFYLFNGPAPSAVILSWGQDFHTGTWGLHSSAHNQHPSTPGGETSDSLPPGRCAGP